MKTKIRRILLFLSFFSFMLSLALPGVGWLLAVITLTTISLLTHLIGRGYVIVTLIVSTIHLFTFGPLSLLGQSGVESAQLPIFYLIIFVIVPAVLALFSIFRSSCEPHHLS